MKIVIDIPNHVKNRLIFGTTYKDDLRIMVEALEKSTPLIERPKGKWIWDLRMGLHKCSVCSKFCDFDYLYCPNCGAEMGGAE